MSKALIEEAWGRIEQLERENAALRRALDDAKGTIDALLDELGVPREHSTTVDCAYETLDRIDAAMRAAAGGREGE